jgi:hypothetical protein
LFQAVYYLMPIDTEVVKVVLDHVRPLFLGNSSPITLFLFRTVGMSQTTWQ